MGYCKHWQPYGAANKARDYLMTLPDRFKKISERGLKAPMEYQFSWIRY
jgi:hypothetical protein